MISLSNIIRTRFAGRIFAPDFISFFARHRAWLHHSILPDTLTEVIMKKKLLSLVLTVCLLCPSLTVNAAASFTDISDTDTALAAAVLQSMGIVGGIGEGLYSPDTVLTRAQFCVFMLHSLGMKDQVSAHSYKTLFTDVKPGNWYAGYVNLAYSQNLLAGYGNGTFGPDDPVTYGQAATLLLRMLGYTSADVGKVWPTDYVNYAHTLELDAGLSLSPNKGITRGQAAILLYNTLKTEGKGAKDKLYQNFGDTAAVQKAIVLDPDAQNGTATGQLMACVLNTTGASVEYFSQKNPISSFLVGYEGELLLNPAGKVLGFVPGSTKMEDIVLSSAKASGITDAAGVTHRIPGSTVTIVGQDIYTWNSSGYIQVNALSGRTARLYYDEDGAVTGVYVPTGTTNANASVAVAYTNTPAQELARQLGITGSYAISKNGTAAQADDLARYDTAYYDSASRTLCASDYRITGYIESAFPSVDGAQTVTVAGCTLSVLEAAWDTLEDHKLGDRVTLLLTDDGKVAAAFSPSTVKADMVGVLSLDGSSITLCSSGLTIRSADMDADERLRGTLVQATVYQDSIACSAWSSSVTGDLNIARNTLGNYELAPACRIYEHGGSNLSNGYVYSLSGELGAASTDFEDIFWTNTIDSNYISGTHLNSAGQIDLILLRNVTGNSFEYGKLTRYTGTEGVMTASSPKPIFNSAATITNSSGQSQKHLSAHSASTYHAYYGIALRSYSTALQEVVSLVKLTQSKKLEANAFFLRENDWYVTMNGYELPISDQVQIYIEPTDQWVSGYDHMTAAVSAGLPLVAHYDKDLASGAMVRVLVAQEVN